MKWIGLVELFLILDYSFFLNLYYPKRQTFFLVSLKYDFD